MTLSAAKLEMIERQRARVWALCYRMTGDRAAADDLAQESLAKAVQRGHDAAEETFEGWLFRVATTTCLDWHRTRAVERAAVSLVDPLDLPEPPFSPDDAPKDGETTLLRREDMRLAIVTCLQALSPRQRAVLVLRDVLDRSSEETADALGLHVNNVKVLLHRARASLERAHRIGPCDAPVDAAVVERFAACLESRDLDALTALLADDVWGLVDDGNERRRPTLGSRAVSRQWTNAFGRYLQADEVRRVHLNGEPTVLVVIGGHAFAMIHLESRAGRVVSIRVLLDPLRLARLEIGAR